MNKNERLHEDIKEFLSAATRATKGDLATAGDVYAAWTQAQQAATGLMELYGRLRALEGKGS